MAVVQSAGLQRMDRVLPGSNTRSQDSKTLARNQSSLRLGGL